MFSHRFRSTTATVALLATVVAPANTWAAGLSPADSDARIILAEQGEEHTIPPWLLKKQAERQKQQQQQEEQQANKPPAAATPPAATPPAEPAPQANEAAKSAKPPAQAAEQKPAQKPAAEAKKEPAKPPAKTAERKPPPNPKPAANNDARPAANEDQKQAAQKSAPPPRPVDASIGQMDQDEANRLKARQRADEQASKQKELAPKPGKPLTGDQLKQAGENAGTADTGLTKETAESEAKDQQRRQQQQAKLAAAAEQNGGDRQQAPRDGGGKAIVHRETVRDDQVRRPDDRHYRGDDYYARDQHDDGGLSTAEKIALFGLGALAVGAILNNGDQVVSRSDDRAVVVQDDGSLQVWKNDDEILRQPGAQVETRTYDDGSTLTTYTYRDGTEVRTVRDEYGRVLRRTKVLPDGRSVQLFDDTQSYRPVDVANLPRRPAPVYYLSSTRDLDQALYAPPDFQIDRSYSLGQVRNIRAVRELMPEIDVDEITFDTGSAVITRDQAEKLTDLGNTMKAMIDNDPQEVFLVEGYTDAVGSAASNLQLSDRRAESLAAALSEYFAIPPENLVIQGYGEEYLKVATPDANRDNRRVAVRRITPLLTADAG